MTWYEIHKQAHAHTHTHTTFEATAQHLHHLAEHEPAGKHSGDQRVHDLSSPKENVRCQGGAWAAGDTLLCTNLTKRVKAIKELNS